LGSCRNDGVADRGGFNSNIAAKEDGNCAAVLVGLLRGGVSENRRLAAGATNARIDKFLAMWKATSREEVFCRQTDCADL
jgi:hypothetical protein